MDHTKLNKKKIAKKVIRRVEKGQGLVESTRGPKRKVISKPKGTVGSVKKYGTPYNGLNSQLLKFTPSEEQAALLAWMHTVANPRTKNPHPVPISAVPGASASTAFMYQTTQTAIGHANAFGFFAAAPCTLSLVPLPVGGGATQIPTPMGYDLVGTGVNKVIGFITDSAYIGSGAGSISFPGAGVSLAAYSAGEIVGLYQPASFAPQAGQNSRATLVSVEIRCRPVGAALYSQGRMAAFNYRACPTAETAPNFTGVGDAYTSSMGLPTSTVNRHEIACANWPSDKWLSTVVVPNTSVSFGQWLVGGVNTLIPGQPLAWILGSGLPSGAPVEVQVTWNMAVYGAVSYQTGFSSGSDTTVDAGRASPVVMNASKLIVPRQAADAAPGTHTRPTAAGLASVVKAEQSGNRMPSAKEVIGGVKMAKEVIEGVTGIDIAEEIGEVIAGIAAFL